MIAESRTRRPHAGRHGQRQDLEGYLAPVATSSQRRCSNCRTPGHDIRICPILIAPPIAPVRLPHEGKLSPDTPALSNTACTQYNGKLMEIRGIPKECKPIFTDVVNTVMSIMHYYSANAPNSIRLENAINAFFFLPNLIINKKGKVYTNRILTNILIVINESTDPVSDILEKREEYIINRPLSTNFVQRRKTSADNENDSIPIHLSQKIDKLMRTGRIGKACQELERFYKVSGEPIAKTHDENGVLMQAVVDKIQALHPSPVIQPNDSPDEPEEDGLGLPEENCITLEELSEQVVHLPKLSSSGLIGWTNELVQFLFLHNDSQPQNENQQVFQKLLLKTINLLIKGKMGKPTTWIKSLLIPLSKKKDEIRPIAIDNVFMRLTGKALMGKYGKQAGEDMLPMQNGVGISG
jgi:hypothetical protein